MLNNKDNLPHLKNFSKVSPHFTSYCHCPRSVSCHLTRILSVSFPNWFSCVNWLLSPITFHRHQSSSQNRTDRVPSSNTFTAFWLPLLQPKGMSWPHCPVFQPLTFPTQISLALSTRSTLTTPLTPIWNTHLLLNFHSTPSTCVWQHLPQVLNDCPMAGL